MSGICGVLFHDQGARVTAGDLLPMVRALNLSGHGDGFATAIGPVGVGAQRFPGRLAGVAEMTVHGRPWALAFHGSLYNLRELAPAAGATTEPLANLLRAFVDDGMTLLQRLRGEFALALWDGRDEHLHLATDRFRVHSLLYYQDHEKLVFASRMKSVLACPFPIKPTINPQAVVNVMENSVIPTPKTIFQEVYKLPPGHMLSCRKGDVTVAPYWDINFLHPVRSSEAELAGRLKVCFEDAVSTRYHTDGDSPRVGTFLSGGVDSSTVTGVLTQVAGRPITSVSIGFEEQRFNEMNYARMAAQAFGSKHVEYFVTPTDTFDALPMVVDAFDEPFANASAIPTYYCAKVAKEHGVEVMYAGDGGDELFAGNERYATERLFEYYRRIPAWLREPLIRPLVFALADGLKQSLFVKGKKYILRASIPFPQRLYSYELFSVVPMASLLDDSLLAAVGRGYNPNEHIDRHYGLAPGRTELDREMYVDLKVAIADNDLFKVTRMTEAAGVTVRFPFLDHCLAEFAAMVPAAIRMRGRHLRSFFKNAYADMLPSAILTKTKHGFGLPIPVWLRTDKRLNDMMHDLVLSPRSVQRGYFRKAALEDLVERHKGDETSFYGGVLWNLMILELWHRRHSL